MAIGVEDQSRGLPILVVFEPPYLMGILLSVAESVDWRTRFASSGQAYGHCTTCSEMVGSNVLLRRVWVLRNAKSQDGVVPLW